MRRRSWRAIVLVSLSLAQLALVQGATAPDALARGENPRDGLPTAPGPVASAAVGDTYNHLTQNFVSPGTSDTTVAKLNVPEGNYVVHASVNFTNSTNGLELLNCAVIDTTGNRSFLYSLNTPAFTTDVLSFTTVLAIDASATVELVCSVGSASSSKVALGELTLVRIGTLQRQ